MKHWLNFNPAGLEISNNELFIIMPHSPDIEVYKIEPFVFQRSIPVEMTNPYDIVAGDNVLYVSECDENIIHRIQLPEETVSNWSVDGTLFKLSISKNRNVVVARSKSSDILEYTSGGTFVREIKVDQIDTNLVGLQHAIQLEGDKFLVCHAGKETHNRVCIIDNTGRVIKSYGGNKEQLDWPVHLAIGRDGSILVVDQDNNRIVQLSKSLEYMNEFIEFEEPVTLLLREELGRFYVIEMNDASITILDI